VLHELLQALATAMLPHTATQPGRGETHLQLLFKLVEPVLQFRTQIRHNDERQSLKRSRCAIVSSVVAGRVGS
jgi:glycyl-tRNA synthetase beta subunit